MFNKNKDSSNKNNECKCGHMLEPDHQTESSTFGIKYKTFTRCNLCCCQGHISKSYPNTYDKISIWIMLGGLGFIVIMLGLFTYTAYERYQQLLLNDPDHLLMKTFVRYSGVFKILPVIFIPVMVWLSFNMISIVQNYMKSKTHDYNKNQIMTNDMTKLYEGLNASQKNDLRRLIKDEG